MSKELKEKLSRILDEHRSDLDENGVKSLSSVVDALPSSKSGDFIFSEFLTDHFKSSESKFKHAYIPGTTPDDDEFEYKRDIGCLPVTEGIRKQFALPNLPGTQRKDFSPTKGELTKINEMTGRPFTKEELKVYPVVFWDAQYDSHLERFSLKATKEGRRLAVGAPGIKDHDTWNSDGVFSRVFDAETVQQDGNHYLVGKIFMLNTPENKSIIDGFESSINCEISVGVRGKRDEYICDICDRPMWKFSNDPKQIWCGHYTGQRLPNNKVVTATIDGVSFFKEFSRVVRGAQRAARVRVKADESNSSGTNYQKSNPTSTLFPNSGSEEIEVDEILKALKDMEEQVTQNLTKLEEKVEKRIGEISDSVAELKKASEDTAKPQDPPAQPAPAASSEAPAAPAPAPAAPAPAATTDANKTEAQPAPVAPPAGSASSVVAEVDMQKAFTDRLKLLEDFQSANIEMTKNLQEQNKQIHGQLEVMAKAYTALTTQCSELVKTSQDSIVADLANFRTEKVRAVEQEAQNAELAKKDGGITGAVSGFVGALTNFGEKK